MFKFTVLLFVLIACVAANPDIIANAPLTYAAPTAVVAAPAPVVTATSSHVIARNYNGIAAAPVVARYAGAAHLPVSLTSPHYVAPFAAASFFW
ncbi:uncharacterized protein LOC114803516 [Zeugodacus cucurbitae]|uniref:uncharacterized protein LOC114803516 n=1 Tax=Zeugodacus cucurbitae TaxID=28588 RepID=UPI0010A74E06|nr:uncharacterized protein LOC114803516 [Zeugodacus cucurbitae]